MTEPSFDSMIDFANVSQLDAKQFADRLQWAYSRVLDAAGINMADPVIGNMRYFNVWGHRPNLEPTRVGKTYIFMTRPDLNFADSRNLFQVPYFRLSSITEMGRILMTYLMHPPLTTSGGAKIPKLSDNNLNYGLINDATTTSPFIPIVTNLCTESSGSKDLVLDLYETDADYSGNKLQYGGGMDESESIGEMTLNYEDIIYSPAMFLNYLWVLYIHFVSHGVIVPMKKYIVNKVIDYSSSIYTFVCDSDGQSIIRWSKHTGVFPRSVPMGLIQHTHDINPEMLRKFTITYGYNRYEAMKPHILSDFNRLCRPYMNPLLTSVDSGGSGVAAKLKMLRDGVSGVPLKAVENPMNPQARGNSAIAGGSANNSFSSYPQDKMRSWYGGHPYILGSKLVFLRPDDVLNKNDNGAIQDNAMNTKSSAAALTLTNINRVP